MAFPESDVLCGGPTVPSVATWTKLMSQLSQTCDKSDVHAALRAAMLDPLVAEGGQDSQSQEGDEEEGLAAAAAAAELGESRLDKIRRALLRAEEQREPPLPEHVDPRALQPALKVIESIERDPVLYNALLSLPLVKPPPSSKKGGKASGGGGGGGGGGRGRKGATARPRLNLQQEIAHILGLGVANRSLQTVLVGLKALVTLYETTTPSLAMNTTPGGAQQQQQQEQPPPELPQCGPVLRSLGAVRLPGWDTYLKILEREEEAERVMAVTGIPRLEVCNGSPVSLGALEVTGGPCSAIVRSVRVPLAGRVYYEVTITGGTGGSKTAAYTARGLRLGWAACGICIHGKLGDSDTSIGFDGARQRIYCDARARAAAEKPPPPLAPVKAEAPTPAPPASAEGKQQQQQPPPPQPPASEVAAPKEQQQQQQQVVVPATPTAAEAKGGGSTGASSAKPPPPPRPAVTRRVSSSGDDAAWDTEGLTGLFVEEGDDEEEEEDEERLMGGGDGGRPVATTGLSSTEGWKVGDVVGCLADMEARSFTFHVNGVVKAEVDFLEFSPSQEQGLCPALSLTRPGNRVGVSLNLGQEPFRYEPFFRTTVGGKMVIRATALSNSSQDKASSSSTTTSTGGKVTSPTLKGAESKATVTTPTSASSPVVSPSVVPSPSTSLQQTSGKRSSGGFDYRPVTQDLVSSCLVLDGTGMVEMPFAQVLRFTTGVTLELLVKVTRWPATGARAYLMGSTDFGLVVLDSGQLGFHNATGSPSPDLTPPPTNANSHPQGQSSPPPASPAPPSLPLNRWCHLALVVSYEAKTVSVLRDGEVLVSAFMPQVQKLAQNLNKSLSVGGRLSDADIGGEPLDGVCGCVAEVRLWSVARKAEEIKAGAGRRGVTGEEEGLTGWWRVDEAGGHEVHDLRIIKGKPTSNTGLFLGEVTWGSCRDNETNNSGGGGDQSQQQGGGNQGEEATEHHHTAAGPVGRHGSEAKGEKEGRLVVEAVGSFVSSLPPGCLPPLDPSGGGGGDGGGGASHQPPASLTVSWVLLGVLGRLHGLCTAYLKTAPNPETPSKLQSLRHLGSDVHLIAHPHVLTFLLLASLLRQLARLLAMQPQTAREGVSWSCPRVVLSVSLLAVLRILRANLYHLEALGVAPGRVGLGTSARQDDLTKPFIYRLLDLLLAQLLLRQQQASPPSVVAAAGEAQNMSNALQEEVVSLLSTGIEIFYPDHMNRQALVLSLLESSSTPSPPSDEGGEGGSSSGSSAAAAADPARGVLPRLDPFAHRALLSRVCSRLGSSLRLTLPFVPRSMRVLPAITSTTTRHSRAPLTWVNSSLTSQTQEERKKKAEDDLGGGGGADEEDDDDDDGEGWPGRRMVVGALVVRGPDWRWGNQDGGGGDFAAGGGSSSSGKGLVVSVGPWGEGGRGCKVRVVWGGSGHHYYCNVYRYRVPENGRVVSDVCLAVEQDELSLSSSSSSRLLRWGQQRLLLGRKPQQERGEEERFKVDYSVEAVRKALLAGAEGGRGAGGGAPLTKRTVLRYMRAKAPSAWLSDMGLEGRPENAIVRELSAEEVVRLYTAFYRDFASTSEGAGSGDQQRPEEEEEEEKGEGGQQPKAEGAGGKRAAAAEGLFRLMRLLSSALKEGRPDQGVTTLLGGLQLIISGLFQAPSDASAIPSISLDSLLSRYRQALRAPRSRDFRGESGVTRHWDWSRGRYVASKEGDESGGGSLALEAASSGGGGRAHRTTTRVEYMRIDAVRCHGTMMVTDNGLSLEQGPEKGWGVALSRRGFARNTGVHRWKVRLDRVNRRGHVFLGVARRGVGLASFLGNDGLGWGYLQSQDLYHAGSRKRAGYGEKINQGCTVDVVLNTDEGTMSIGDADRGVGFGVAFQDLFAGCPPGTGSDSLIYPAFSLHHPGDMVTIVGFEGVPAPGDDGDESFLLGSGALDGGAATAPIFLGAPPKGLVAYLTTLLEGAITVLPIAAAPSKPGGVKVVEDEEEAAGQSQEHPVVSLLLPLCLMAVYRWQTLALDDEALMVALGRKGRELLAGPLEAAHRLCTQAMAKASSGGGASAEKEAWRGRLHLVTRLELVLATVLGRLAATEYEGPLETCSNQHRAQLERALLEPQAPRDSPPQPPPAPPQQQATGKGYGGGHEDEGASLQASWIKSVLFARGLSVVPRSQRTALLGDRSLDEKLREMTEGEGGTPWLERWLSIHVPQAQALSRLGGPLITRAIRASLVALLYHAGCLKATLRLASALAEMATAGDQRWASLEASKPPYFLLEAWRKASSLRTWARSRVELGVSYEATAASLLARVRCLLDLQPCLDDQPVEAVIDAIIAGEEYGDGTAQLTASGLVEVTSALVRGVSGPGTPGGGLALSRESSGRAAGQSLRMLANKRLLDVLQSTLAFLQAASVDVVALRARQLSSLERARRRTAGLQLSLGLLRSVRSDACAAKAAVLAHFTASTRGCLSTLSNYSYQNSDIGLLTCMDTDFFQQAHHHHRGFPFHGPIRAEHYLEGLQGAGTHALLGVQGAFEALCSFTASELPRQDFDDAGAVEEMQLPLLDSWGLIIKPGDHDMLARVKLFHVLQEVLKGANEEEGTYEAPEMAHMVTRATMTLVYLLAMQVAMADADEEAAPPAPPSTPDRGVELVRARSGPATLSDAVFRMLYSELHSILAGLDQDNKPHSTEKQQPPQQQQELQVLLSEITTLLLYVCDTPVCRRILSKPSWVALMLDLVRVGPLSAQQRGLRLLRSVLPWCPPRALEDAREGGGAGGLGLLQGASAPFSSMVSADDAARTSKSLVLFLMDLVAKPFIRATKKQKQQGGSDGGGANNNNHNSNKASSSAAPSYANAVRGGASTSSSWENAGGSHSNSIPLSNVALSNEALALLTTLLPSSGPWSEVTQSLLAQALDAVTVLRSVFADQVQVDVLEGLVSARDEGEEEGQGEEEEDDDEDDDPSSEVHQSLRYGLSALAVLGGHVSFLYPGGRAELLMSLQHAAAGSSGAVSCGAGGGGPRREGLLVRVDFAKGEAEIRLDPLVRPAAAAQAESAAAGNGGAAISSSDAANGVGGVGGYETRIVPTDLLRALPGAGEASFRPSDLPASLVAKVVETVCLWTFLPIETDQPDDDDDDDDGSSRLDDHGGHDDDDDDDDDDGDDDAGTRVTTTEPPRRLSLPVQDLILLIRSLQCYALRALDTLVKEQAVAEQLLSLTEVPRPALLRDLMQLAVRHKTDVRGLSGLPAYEENLTLLLLHRHHTHLPAATAKVEEARQQAQEPALDARGGAANTTAGEESKPVGADGAQGGAPTGGRQGGGGTGGDEGAAEDEDEVNPVAAQLAEMGFPLNWCQRALRETGDNLEDALNWILANGELLAVEDSSREEAEQRAAAEQQQQQQQQQQQATPSTTTAEAGASGGTAGEEGKAGTEATSAEEPQQQQQQSSAPAVHADGSSSDSSSDSSSSSSDTSSNMDEGVAPMRPVGAGADAAGGEAEQQPVVEIWRSPTEEPTGSGWPRYFHVDPSTGAYVSVHASPDTSSEKIATYFAGEEVFAVAEQGDWLQVRVMTYEDEEDDDNDEEEDKEGDGLKDEDDDDNDDDDDDDAQLGWMLRRNPEGRDVLLPGPVPEQQPSYRGAAGEPIVLDEEEEEEEDDEGLSDSGESMQDEDDEHHLRSMHRHHHDPHHHHHRRKAKDLRYRVVDRAGLQVRRGMEMFSVAVCVLATGTEIRVASESLTSAGYVRLRVTEPVKGWATKKPGALERISTTGGAGGGEVLAPLSDDLSPEEALARMEDGLEQEMGQELFRKEDRYFPGRGSSSMWHSMGGRGSGGGGGGGAYGSSAGRAGAGARRGRLMNQDSVQGVWRVVASMKTAQEVDTWAGKTLVSLTALQARHAVLALLLHWRDGLVHVRLGQAARPDTRTLLCPLLAACSAPTSEGGGEGSDHDDGRAAAMESAELMEKLLRLLTFRSNYCKWGWEAEFARLHGSSFRRLFQDGGGLDLIPSSLRTLPALLGGVVQALLLSEEEPGKKASQLADALHVVLLTSITKQLRVAAGRAFADASWAETVYEDDDDREALTQPSLQLTRWLSRLLYQTARDVWGLELGGGGGKAALFIKPLPVSSPSSTPAGNSAAAGGGSSTVVAPEPRGVVFRLFAAWAAALKSPGLSLKYFGCVELACMLADVFERYSRCRAQGQSKDAELLADLLRSLLGLLPVDRLRAVAASRLRFENEDAPMYSRFLQSLVELVALLDTVQEAVIGSEALHKAASSGLASETRPVLFFPPGKGSHMFVEAVRENLEPPWTAEFWIRRAKTSHDKEDDEGGDDEHKVGEEEQGAARKAAGSGAGWGRGGGRGRERRGGSSGSSAGGGRGGGGPPPSGAWGSTISERQVAPPPQLTRTQSITIAEEEEQMQRQGNVGGQAGAGGGTDLSSVFGAFDALVASPLARGSSKPGSSSSSTMVDAVMGEGSDDDEYLLLSAEDIPPMPPSSSSVMPPPLPMIPSSTTTTTTTTTSSSTTGQQTTGGSSSRPRAAPSAGRGGAVRRGGSSSSSRGGVSGGRGGGGSRSGGGDKASSSSSSHDSSAATTAAPAKPVRTVPPMYLVRSSSYSIKVQAGGKVFDDQANDDVPSQALCVAISVSGDTDRAFDYVLPCEEWTHLAFVARRSHRSSSEVTLYVDGKSVGAVPVKVCLPVQMVGSHDANESLVGHLAGVRYWNYDRSPAEIARDMNVDVSEAAEGLVGWWRLKEGRGSHVADQTNTFRSCTQRKCVWEVRSDAPRLFPSLAVRSGREALLHPSMGLLPEGSEVLELTGAFEREAVRGVEGPWVRPWREPFVVRLNVPEGATRAGDDADGEKEKSGGGGGGASGRRVKVEGVVEWPEKRARAFCRGTLLLIPASGGGSSSSSSDRRQEIELEVEDIAEGCPATHGWLVGTKLKGWVSDEGRQLEATWEVATQLVRKKALGIGGMRIDPVFAHDDVIISDDDMVVGRADVRGGHHHHGGGGGAAGSGCVVTVEVCTAVPIKQGIKDPGPSLDWEALPVIDELAEATVDEVLKKWQDTDLLTSSEGGDFTVMAVNDNDQRQQEEDGKTYGYTRGKWFWEWQVMHNSSGNIGVGVCTAKASMQASLGRDGDGWAYFSTSEMFHASDGPHGFGASESFGNGDVVGIQLDLDEGSLHFIKNDRDLGLGFINMRDHPALKGGPGYDSPGLRGLRPCAYLGGPSDKVMLLGLKRGPGRRLFEKQDSFQRHEFMGQWKFGVRHGPGVLRYQKFPGFWRGLWWGGMQHGVQLWITTDEHGREVKATPFLFERDVLVRELKPQEVARILEAWEREIKAKQPPPPPPPPTPTLMEEAIAAVEALSTLTTTTTTTTTTTSAPATPPAGGGGGEVSTPGASTTTTTTTTATTSASTTTTTTVADDAAVVTPPPATPSSSTTRDAAVQPPSVPIPPPPPPPAFSFSSPIPPGAFCFSSPAYNVSTTTTTTTSELPAELPPGTDVERVKALVAASKALYVVRIIYEAGATVRNGIEIDLADQVRNVAKGTILEVTQRVVTPEGIPRLKIAGGWISERLRGGNEDIVVQVLRHQPETPLKYRIKRGEGAMVRRGAELESEEVGLIPQGTVITVTERRRIMPEGTMRLRIVAPAEWEGWASEKENLVEREPETEAERDAELHRRVVVKSLREQERKREEAQAAKEAEERRRAVRATVKGRVSVTSKTFFVMDRTQCSSGLRVSDDFLTATFDSSPGGGASTKAVVLGSKGFRQGLAYWEVKVEQAGWGSVFIGVSPRSGRSGWQGYGFLNYRAVQAYGSETLYGSYFGPGDTIGVLLDMDRGTIAFIKDGEDFNVGRPVVINMGVAYHYLRRGTREGIPTTMYPCFGMKSPGDQLSLRHCKWYHTRGMDRWRQLEVVRESMRTALAWWRHVHLGTELSPSAVEAIYRVYRDWKSRRKLRYQARGGGEVEVDCTKKSLEAAVAGIHISGAEGKGGGGWEIGMRLSTPYGEGRVVGVARGDVWYALDSEGGKVWYWTSEELKALVASKKVVVAPHTITTTTGSGGAAPAVTSNEGEAKAEPTTTPPPAATPTASKAGGSLSSSSSEEGVDDASVSLFAAALNEAGGGGWSVEMDDALVKLVNAASSRLGLPATHIPYADLEHAFRMQATPPLRDQLHDRPLTSSMARFAAILWLNRAVSACVPLVNLGVHGVGRPPLVTEHDLRAMAEVPALTESVVGRLVSPLGQVLSSLRGSIFTSSKLSLWNEVLTESTTLTVPPADEYERPDELREVVLNRMQARRATTEAKSLPYSERLRLSLFGQLRDHMVSWDDRSLRRSFVHMQDAGQPRAFYVKFTGEGVDDHGGPYRAVFETAVGEEPVGPLELLVPCPNAVLLMGENRDQYLLNPASSEQRLPLFHHLGRLMGVATRHRILVPLSLPTLVWRSVAGMAVGRPELQAVDKLMAKSFSEVEKKRREDEDEEGEEEWEEVRAMLLEKIAAREGRPVVLREGMERQVEKAVLVGLAEQAKLMEGADGLAALMDGLGGILPLELLSIFTTGEVESIMCGVPTVDISILKKATDYDGVSPQDPHIQAFWEVLEEMDVEDRRSFINFCSGRSRLPASAADFPMNFKLTAPQPRSDDKPDDYLPVAQTCFFSLSVPRYSSKEVCKEKLLYAIHNADLMDADFLMRNAEGWAGFR